MDLLKKVENLEKDAADFGFRWENPSQIMEQILSECKEVFEHLEDHNHDPKHLQEEIGDLLHAVFSLCVFCKFDTKETLKNTLTKFEKRLKEVKKIAKSHGLSTLEGHNFDELMQIWDEAKQNLK